MGPLSLAWFYANIFSILSFIKSSESVMTTVPLHMYKIQVYKWTFYLCTISLIYKYEITPHQRLYFDNFVHVWRRYLLSFILKWNIRRIYRYLLSYCIPYIYMHITRGMARVLNTERKQIIPTELFYPILHHISSLVEMVHIYFPGTGHYYGQWTETDHNLDWFSIVL